MRRIATSVHLPTRDDLLDIWTKAKPVESQDHTSLIFLIHEIEDQRGARAALRVILEGMNTSNMPAFMRWCDLYLQAHNFKYVLRPRKTWVMGNDIVRENVVIGAQLYDLIRELNFSGCNEGLRLSAIVQGWLDNGIPNFLKTMARANFDRADCMNTTEGPLEDAAYQADAMDYF
ncbi:hypothetical protein HDV00_007377 [Rhizophlyctis rosea]|nr:hypothetical protein HDV00_007377 [Rhizophlyctis rosea]